MLLVCSIEVCSFFILCSIANVCVAIDVAAKYVGRVALRIMLKPRVVRFPRLELKNSRSFFLIGMPVGGCLPSLL